MSKPTEAEFAKRKHRWYQFSLRTLLIVVTLLAVACGYVGWEAKVWRTRKAMVRESEELVVLMFPNEYEGEIPVVRRWLGDHAYTTIWIGAEESEEVFQRYTDVFPEADVTLVRMTDIRRAARR